MARDEGAKRTARVGGSKGKVGGAKPTPRVEGRSTQVEGRQRVARVTTSARLGILLAFSSVVLSFAAFEALVRLAKPDLSIPQAAGHFRFTQSFEFELPHHLRDPLLGWRLQPGVYGGIPARLMRALDDDDAAPTEKTA